MLAVIEHEPVKVDAPPVRVEPTEADLFRKAADLLEHSFSWSQGEWGHSADGRPLESPCDSDAVSLCGLGAIYRAMVILNYKGMFDVSGYGFKEAIHRWNDQPGRTKAEVIERFRRIAEGEFS